MVELGGKDDDDLLCAKINGHGQRPSSTGLCTTAAVAPGRNTTAQEGRNNNYLLYSKASCEAPFIDLFPLFRIQSVITPNPICQTCHVLPSRSGATGGTRIGGAWQSIADYSYLNTAILTLNKFLVATLFLNSNWTLTDLSCNTPVLACWQTNLLLTFTC